jgi:hypothetical protein
MHPNGLCAGVHSSGDASRPGRRCGPAKRLLALFVRYGTVGTLLRVGALRQAVGRTVRALANI